MIQVHWLSKTYVQNRPNANPRGVMRTWTVIPNDDGRPDKLHTWRDTGFAVVGDTQVAAHATNRQAALKRPFQTAVERERPMTDHEQKAWQDFADKATEIMERPSRLEAAATRALRWLKRR